MTPICFPFFNEVFKNSYQSFWRRWYLNKGISWIFLYNFEKNYWMPLPWSVGEIENDLSFNCRIYACPYFVVFFDIFILFFSQSSSRHSTITNCRHFSWVCHWPCCFFLCYNGHHHHKVNVNCVHLHAIFWYLSMSIIS